LLLPHTLDEWCAILNMILADFLPSSDAYRNELSSLRQWIGNLADEQRAAKSIGRIELSILKSCLQEAFASPGGMTRFLSGGVSFCALLPMRNIPFAVICLMGMDNDVYPRRDRKIGFNVMETNPRAGDRSLRNDDQYLFLEAILAAGKNLVISYVGQSAADNSEILPSVLVCEFLDYLDKNYCGETGQPLSKEITGKHRLHAFSPAYFGEDKNLFSYSKQNYQAACAILGRKEEKPPFCETALSSIAASTAVLSVKDLLGFYRNPARYFLENRLCLKLPAALWEQEKESEPFTIDALSAYQMKQALVESHLKSGDDEGVLQQKRAEGILPVGSAGDYAFRALNYQAKHYAGKIQDYLKGRQLDNCRIDLQIGDDRLMGTLDNLYADYRIHYRMAGLKASDYMSAWIFHLILNAAPVDGYPQSSLLLGEDRFCKFGPVENAQEILERLIRYYSLGQTKPLKFFARSSWEYAQALWLKNKSREEAIRAAHLAWAGDDYGQTEAEYQETACRICFENVMPIDDEFEKTATDILKDLFAHLDKPE
jgi:exodeoxyribonuclease V gamma subunit